MKDLIMMIGGIVAVLLMMVGCHMVITCDAMMKEIGIWMATTSMCMFLVIWGVCIDD